MEKKNNEAVNKDPMPMPMYNLKKAFQMCRQRFHNGWGRSGPGEDSCMNSVVFNFWQEVSM